ncbi:MAG: HAMP domain-containing protein, partial [Peptococcaceae bacterium]|nr:HAMP domain-containing protein [Peptococcaceae bacterium]
MRHSLRSQLTLTILLIVLFTVALISFLTNRLIGQQFEAYVWEQEKTKATDIADNLSRQYDELTQSWNLDFVHGVGMYSLYDGYIIQVYDRDGASVWDAENHDMSLCRQIMDEISARMESKRPQVGGAFTSQSYDLTANGQTVGSVTVSYYGPYFLNDSDFRFLDTLNTVLIAIGGLSLLLSLAAGWILARRLARPISKTAYIAKQIAQGNYDIRFEGRTKTKELDDLVAAINQLADALSEQEHLRKRLSADVAHELRTPLTAVGSHLEAMIEGVWQPTPERLQSCHEEIGRLGKLVADLERLTQAESETLTLHRSLVDLAAIARAASDSLALELKKKNLTLVVNGESALVFADGDRISQVAANLLSNAIKYTPENGLIRVTTRDTADNGVLIVEDDGIGIPAKDLPFIFERFYRTDQSRTRSTGGTGIGLAIVKSIVQAHGGSVQA